MSLHVGQSARIRGNLSATQAGKYVPSDPLALSVFVTKPSGTILQYDYGTSVELTRVGTGQYELVVPLDQSGTWKVKWQTASFRRTIPFAVLPE